jgi:Flp pilus assembly protein TadB
LGQSTEKPVIVEALDLTFRTIEKRIKRYRLLLISVVIVTAISSLLAIFYHEWLFTIGWILLVPLIGGFFYFDSRTVRRWRREIVQMRNVRNLDLDFFLKTIGELHRISPPMLKGMLSTIESNQQEDGKFDERQQKIERLTLVATILLTAGLICFVGAAYYRSPMLLLCGIAFALSLVKIHPGSTRTAKKKQS